LNSFNNCGIFLIHPVCNKPGLEDIELKGKIRLFLKQTAWGTLLALFLIFLFHYFAAEEENSFKGIRSWLAPLWVIFFINFIFQGLLWLDRHLDRRIPWFHYPRKRLFTELAITFPASLALLSLNYAFMFEFSSGTSNGLTSHQRFLYTYIIIMIVFAVAITVVIAANFFRNWRQSLLEVEQLKEEKMKSDYLALQNQLNPHFLFNNFNLLLSEIRRDKENAIRITEKLADVYRYVLESKSRETVSLCEELAFADAIIFLQKVRFGHHLEVHQQIDETLMEYRLPPLTVQILLENAWKHNVVSSAHPLQIRIQAGDGSLSISNNLQPRKSTYSTGLGLKNIKMRYSYLTQQKIAVKAENDLFTVTIPLLPPKEV